MDVRDFVCVSQAKNVGEVLQILVMIGESVTSDRPPRPASIAGSWCPWLRRATEFAHGSIQTAREVEEFVCSIFWGGLSFTQRICRSGTGHLRYRLRSNHNPNCQTRQLGAMPFNLASLAQFGYSADP